MDHNFASQPWAAYFPVFPADGADLGSFTELFCHSVFRYLVVCCVCNVELQSASGLRRGAVDLIISRSQPGVPCVNDGLTICDLQQEAAADWRSKTCLPGDCMPANSLHRDILQGIAADDALQNSLRFMDGCSCWLTLPVPYRLGSPPARRNRRRKTCRSYNLQWHFPEPNEEAELLVVGARVQFYRTG